MAFVSTRIKSPAAIAVGDIILERHKHPRLKRVIRIDDSVVYCEGLHTGIMTAITQIHRYSHIEGA